MAVIAVFGGTFNPFHIGHYQMLKTLCETEWIDKVFVMPDNVPPHKTCDFLASDEDRINMCRLVVEEFAKAELCLVEFEREGKSYTIDTIKLLKEKYPNDNFYFVCGGDMIATLDTWHDAKRLFEKASFIAFKRQGIDSFEDDVKRMRSLGADITVINADIAQISSSQLRNKPSRGLLPEKVYNYILRGNIYNGN